jgi:L-fucose mutarotase/ribose pyranase (RbsD/FucU family)
MASWKDKVSKELPVLGHRNWIVVADSAYPAQSRAGIETIATNADHIKTLRAVLDRLDAQGHVKAAIFVDAELAHVPERYAKGITAYREKLARTLGKRNVSTVPHEEVISMLDKAGEMFCILILKTRLTLPYTSVFLQLDCGYWSAEAESALREAMKASQ